MANPGFLTRVRDIANRWSSVVAAVGIAAVCELGTRIGLPGVDGKAVQDFIRECWC